MHGVQDALSRPHHGGIDPMDSQPKNILFIMADQLAAAQLGCYGSGVPSTPTLDALSTEGVRFDRCYASTPVCAPNRANLLTGRSPCVHGMVTNNYALATDVPTYAHVLQAHGYRTGGFGKFHQHPMPLGVPENVAYLGFDESILSEDPKWGPWLEWMERRHPEHLDNALALAWGPPPGIPEEKRKRYWQALQRILQPLTAASAWNQFYTSPLPAALHDTTWLTDLGLDFMRRHHETQRASPFFCHVSYVDPHDPYNPPEPYASMFRPEDMPSATPPAWMKKGIARLEESRDHFDGQRQALDNPAVVRELRAKFHGSLKLIDDQIARLVAFLKERGLWEDTLLVFTTDHGEMLGDQALMTKGAKHYDQGIRCPLIVAGGGVTRAVANDLVCSFDFFSTFCGWAGVPEADLPPLEGHSFGPLCAGKLQPDPWREVLVSFDETHSLITSEGWRLTRYPLENKGQLFDLVKDPDEQVDRYEDADCASLRQALLERLVGVMARPLSSPHYRNMPVLQGRKHFLGGLGCGQLIPGPPLYAMGSAPALKRAQETRPP